MHYSWDLTNYSTFTFDFSTGNTTTYTLHFGANWTSLPILDRKIRKWHQIFKKKKFKIRIPLPLQWLGQTKYYTYVRLELLYTWYEGSTIKAKHPIQTWTIKIIIIIFRLVAYAYFLKPYHIQLQITFLKKFLKWVSGVFSKKKRLSVAVVRYFVLT